MTLRHDRIWQICGLVGAIVCLSHPALAQVVEDNTLGGEGSQVIRNVQIRGVDSDRIEGGARRGANLFHSLSQFSVLQGRGAYFANPVGIQNIFSRVTGTGRSNIDGRLGVLGDANLFLINPNGIVFGRNATLDVGGSFIGTTANGLQFGDRGFFNATNPEVPSDLLTVNPSAFLFNQIPVGNIANSSIAPTGTVTPSGIPISGLRVPDGQNLLLVGGDVTLDGGELFAPGGRIELGGLAQPGTINLETHGNVLRLNVPVARLRSDVRLENQALIVVSGAGGVAVSADGLRLSNNAAIASETSSSEQAGSIWVNANSLSLSDGASIASTTLGEGRAGDIEIRVPNGNVTIRETQNQLSGIFNQVAQGALGNAGDIDIRSRLLTLDSRKPSDSKGRGRISDSTNGRGNAGKISLHIDENIQLDQSYIFGNVEAGAQGNAGEISIQSRSLNLLNGAQIGAVVYREIDGLQGGRGRGGTIHIQAANVNVTGIDPNRDFTSGIFTSTQRGATGNGGEISIEADTISVTDRATVSAQTLNSENGGDINIDVNLLRVAGGGQILTSTFNRGNAGSIRINADQILLLGNDPNYEARLMKKGRDIVENVSSYSGIFATAQAEKGSSPIVGNGGAVDIHARSLSLTDQAQISATSFGRGLAGTLTLDISEQLNAANGTIATSAPHSSGGNISINRAIGSGNIVLQDSSITTNSRGDGGNINVGGTGVVALGDSDILASSTKKNGGDITLGRYFGEGQTHLPTNAPFRNNGRPDVNAQGNLTSGSISTTDTSFIQNSLIELPENPINNATLLASSCIVRNRNRQSSFTVTGADDFPARPGQTSLSTFPTGTVRSSSTSQTQPEHPWQLGDPIVEPQGVYQLPDGRLVLSRECSLHPNDHS